MYIRSTAPTFTRPNDTTAYTALDLVANSTTAGSVTNLIFPFALVPGLITIRRVLIRKSTNGATAPTFDLHLFDTAPTYGTNGDNSAVSGNTTITAGSYVGTLAITSMNAMAASSEGMGTPKAGDDVLWRPKGQQGAETVNLFGVLQATGAYAPGAQETFTLTLEGWVMQTRG